MVSFVDFWCENGSVAELLSTHCITKGLAAQRRIFLPASQKHPENWATESDDMTHCGNNYLSEEVSISEEEILVGQNLRK